MAGDELRLKHPTWGKEHIDPGQTHWHIQGTVRIFIGVVGKRFITQTQAIKYGATVSTKCVRIKCFTYKVTSKPFFKS